MSDKKSAAASKSHFPFPDDWDPKPTVFKGGVQRIVDIWTELRRKNTGGYGPGSILTSVGHGKDKWQVAASSVTSCSPFTANVLGMLLDPSGLSSGDNWAPTYDNGTKPLPHMFYSAHQGNLWNHAGYYSEFKKRGWDYANDPAGSMWFWNIGYEIEGRDLRRGDLIGVNWSNGGGHAVFVWDVHLDAKGDVDAFCYLSANGLKKLDGTYAGYGVSIGGCTGKLYKKSGERYITGERGSLGGGVPLFVDRPEHVVDGEWLMLPGKDKAAVTKATNFIHPGPPKNALDHSDYPKKPASAPKGWQPPKWPFHVASITCARLWGIFPPDRAPSNARQGTTWQEAKKLGYEQPKDSYACTGKATALPAAPPPPHIEAARPTVHKGEAEKVKAQPPKPAPQHPDRPAVHQDFVEEALMRLYEAKWLDNHPGDPNKVNNDDTKKAVREFQTKFDAKPIDGIAGPITRKALKKALQDLAAGLPPPHFAAPPTKPRIDRVSWLRNRIEPGEPVFLAVHGVDLDLIMTLQVVLKDRVSKRESKLGWDCVLIDNIGVTPVVIPQSFERGAQIVASFSGTAAGQPVQYEHQVPLYIGAIRQPGANDWPWDEALWTPKMRDIISDLRNTTKPKGPFERWEITQYGVKEKMASGDTEVKSRKGDVFGQVTRVSLMKADIEGTMRLDGKILNIDTHGNVYEPRVVEVDGKKITKMKPNASKFDPARSTWIDVTAKAPWGAGAKMPLIPFRTLALNPHYNKQHFYKKVYIKQLDGMKMPNGEVHNGMCIAGDVGGMDEKHFDLCVGREDHHISIPSVVAPGTICELEILGVSDVSKPGGK